MSMSIPYFFEPVLLVRDRVIVTDPGQADGLRKGMAVDRIEVDHANNCGFALSRDPQTNLGIESWSP